MNAARLVLWMLVGVAHRADLRRRCRPVVVSAWREWFACSRNVPRDHRCGLRSRPPAHSPPCSDTKHQITVVGIKRRGEEFTDATQDTVVRPGDLLIVTGRIDAVEAFANRT